MFVRKKINSSGSISVQILEKTNRTNKLIQTVGSSKDEIEIEKLYNRAFEIIDQLKQQSRFNFYSNQDESILNFTQQLSNSNIQAVGSQLIFGKLFDYMGFNILENQLFKDLVLSRIIYQGSKLKLTEYLKRYENKSISIQRIYRFLDKVHSSYKEQAEDIAFLHTKKVLKNITVVFYDMTTLYFESGDEDDFRKIGFSKDGKFQNPQIMLGLLVGEYGYPIGYELFEGNTFEGHTLIPVLEKFQKRFNLIKPIIIADSGLLSKSNIQQLKAKNYQYILGARIRTSDSKLSQEILSLNLNEDNSICKIKTTDNDNLIVSYTPKRAKKDEYNRTKGLKRLEKKVKSGKLTKDQINSRGYNKYLHLKNEISVEIDYEKFYQLQFQIQVYILGRILEIMAFKNHPIEAKKIENLIINLKQDNYKPQTLANILIKKKKQNIIFEIAKPRHHQKNIILKQNNEQLNTAFLVRFNQFGDNIA